MWLTTTARWRRSYAQACAIVMIFVLVGCLPEETVVPVPVDPAPTLPTLVCAPFIKAGYTDKISYFPGERVKVFIDSKEPVSLCRLVVHDVNGDSVLSLASELIIPPMLTPDAFKAGFNFPVAVEFDLPQIASGVYLIEEKIPFIVKTDEDVDVMVVYPSNTANAYAESGGKSLYSLQDRPEAVSFLRPIPIQALSQVCLKWFTSLENMRLGYITDMDLDHAESVSRAKVLVIAGHSEYWTRKARQNFDAFVNSGKHALI